MAAAMCLFMAAALTGCKKNEPETLPETAPDPLPAAGGWSVNNDFGDAQIPEDAQSALEKALESYDGAKLEPVALLGSQIVAGTNYALLCRNTMVTANPVTKLSVVYVYKDLGGNAEILNVKDLNIPDYTGEGSVDFDPAELTGGWKVYTEYSAKLPDTVQEAFDEALSGLTGVGYNPVAYLGSQVVAGANYAVLCTASTVTAEPSTALAVVIIYDAISGGAQINTICGYRLSID